MTSIDLIATSAFGLEAIVRRELADLGYEGEIISPGRVLFRGDDAAICRSNLWLRTADRVLIRMASFDAPDFDALFETTRALPWQEWIGRDAAFPVSGRSLGSQLSSVPACQRAVKKAVVESLLAAHKTSTLPETGPEYRIEIALLKDVATLTIDTTGASLHKRGYRQFAGGAPLKETLAAALVMLSFWQPERPLIDPFCGSGTIPIEAALIGCRLAPGRLRDFAAETWPQLDATVWREARDEASDLAREPFSERLSGTDLDERALRAARQNAERAGVTDLIHFQQRPFADLSSKRKFGCLITNPPYGQRLDDQADLAGLYRSIPVVLRKLPTWSHFILTSFPDFEAVVGRSADRRRKLYNGRIECTYYQFHGPRPGQRHGDSEAPPRPEPVRAEPPGPATSADEPPAAAAADAETPVTTPKTSKGVQPVFGGVTAKGKEQAELFRNRLRKRARHLRRWPTRRGITCYRLYERDIPEIPLVVDRYEDHLHLTEYERPHDRDPAGHADWLDLLARTAAETLEVDPRKLFFKRRQRQRGTAQHELLANDRYELTVGEGGLKFLVNLSDYVDTGLFLDHRITRSMVRDEAAGTRFLNLFGYTGTFSVYAAAGGAAETTTVDWSRPYLEWAERNMQLNGFRGPNHHLEREDARAFIERLPDKPQFDLAVVDPPTFSNSKRSEDDWNIQRDHAWLLNEVLRRLRPGGVLDFSTNFRRFKLDAHAISAGELVEISRQTVPEDFRNRRIHRCWRIVSDA